MKKTTETKNAGELSAVVAVVSLTGKAGKSTVVNNMLVPLMPSAKLIKMETINLSGLSGASEEVQLKGREIGKLQDALQDCWSAIVDVGASNVESFLLALNQQSDAHLDFDFFIVPIEANSAKRNEMGEAIKTINTLADMGIEPARIKVVFNKLAADSSVEEECSAILKFHKMEGKFTLNTAAAIHDTPAFKALDVAGKSFKEMVGDKTDYRQMMRDTPTSETDKRVELSELMRAQGYVKTLNVEFNRVFKELFGEQYGSQ